MKKIHLIANAHLDPVWQWNWQEGCGEVLMTFRSALDRLDEYPDLVFTCSSAAYYRWVEELDPTMFEEIRQKVKEGRWIPVNGWWVQPDCNLPSGESFARHTLYAQRYYLEKFGRICRTGYNIDSFGHAGSLPQILSHGGMNAYVFMRPGNNPSIKIPYNSFVWTGTDGTEVLAFHLPAEYGLNGSDVIASELKIPEAYLAENDRDTMFFFGVGNHGGGPTKGDIEYLISRIKAGEPAIFSDPDSFFELISKDRSKLPTHFGELQHHARGCYSTTGRIKQLNRAGENALISAEKWDTAAGLVPGSRKASTATLAEAWKDLLFCQFHDSLCGCSIMDVFDDAQEFIGSTLAAAHKVENSAHIRLISNIDTWVDGISDPVDAARFPREFRNHSCPYGTERPVVVFNPHPFEINWPVQTYHPALSVRDSAGHFVPFQNVDGPSSTEQISRDTLFMAKVPPLGYETYWLKAGWNGPTEGAAEKFPTDLRVDNGILENAYLKATVDLSSGLLTSLVLKSTGKELLSAPGARPVVVDDSDGNSWDGPFDKILGTMNCVNVRVIETGPLRGIIRATFVYNHSSLRVDYRLHGNMKALELQCKAIWQEDATMLKLSFPLSENAAYNTAEMPFSSERRCSDGGEEPMHRWVDAGSLSIINNCKYAYDCRGDEIRVTVLRNNRYAYGCCTNNRIEDDYEHTDEGLNRFGLLLFPHDQDDWQRDTLELAALYNEAPTAAFSGYHKGTLPQSRSFVSLESDTGCVMLSALKFAEDASGDIILRLYEASGKQATASVKIPDRNFSVTADFAPFQIKNYRIKADGSFELSDFIET